jgi:hypothetical protein
MPQIKIKVIAVDVTTTPTKTGSYQMAEVSYKNLTFQSKVESKKLMSFGGNAEAFKALNGAIKDDVYDIETVKNDRGYIDWIKVTQGSEGSNASSAAEGSKVSGSIQGTGRSTFETPEERAKKQVYIVRQSSITAALSTLSVGAKSAPDVAKVIEVAKQYEAFVFGVGSLPKQEAPSFPDEEFPPEVE